jgi:beta-lactamase class A
MLSLLVQEEIGGGVVASAPEGTVVAHKTGNFSSANHDIALVWGPAGPYVIAVLTDTLEGWDPVVAVSSAVWQYFVENP